MSARSSSRACFSLIGMGLFASVACSAPVTELEPQVSKITDAGSNRTRADDAGGAGAADAAVELDCAEAGDEVPDGPYAFVGEEIFAEPGQIPSPDQACSLRVPHSEYLDSLNIDPSGAFFGARRKGDRIDTWSGCLVRLVTDATPFFRLDVHHCDTDCEGYDQAPGRLGMVHRESLNPPRLVLDRGATVVACYGGADACSDCREIEDVPVQLHYLIPL